MELMLVIIILESQVKEMKMKENNIGTTQFSRHTYEKAKINVICKEKY
jgi:hypothetical protein